MTTPYIPVKQIFTFSYSSPNSCTENATPIKESVTTSFEGEDLDLQSVVEKFKDFLRAVSYNVDKVYIDD